jgi:PPR repeat.
MTFDKTKAMRNAERFLSQGKIASAIGEFRQVVTHDPRDFSTMNMLGDLYAKNSEMRPAADCYKAVAEHYAKQGFAQKAIAVYNKVAKIQPNTAEITERLAGLYKEKGSFQDAKVHYQQLADHYQRAGRRIEALEVWKEIAELDPNNAEAYVSVGEGYAAENCAEEAAESFAEAGRRYLRLSQYEKALKTFERSLQLSEGSIKTLNGYVDAAYESGIGSVAVTRLEQVTTEKPYDREIQSLLVDCYVRSGDMTKAERSLVKLIEHEPSCYPKLLELNRVYMAGDDETSAARVLSMSSEHMLMEGKAEELSTLVTAVLDKDPEQLTALG